MHEFTVITAPQDLLPQVVGELLAFAANPDLVDVVHGSLGREIHAHPEVAEAWYQARQQVDEPAKEPVHDPAPVPAPVQEVSPVPAAVAPVVNKTEEATTVPQPSRKAKTSSPSA